MSLHPNETEREAFLKALKVGDTVCVYVNTRGSERWTKATVERITPKKAFRIREKGGDSAENFNARGVAHKGGSWGWYEVLEPWTAEVEAHLARIKLVTSVMFYLDRSVVDRELVEALPDDELKRLVMALRPFRKKPVDNTPA